MYLQNGLRFPQFRFLDLTTEQKPQSPTFREKFDPKGNDVHFSVKFANEFVQMILKEVNDVVSSKPAHNK